MSFKQIFIRNRSYLSYQNNSMRIKNENIETTVSLDDIDIIMVENQQTTITSALISNLAKADILVMFVDKQFLPSAISIGLYKNSRTAKIQKAQVAIKKPRLNRLWRDLIKKKITNQSLVLKNFKKDDSLDGILKKVVSGDRNGAEATAAAYYFKKLFGKEFSRMNIEDSRNIALNYGYSIIRSSIARHIVAFGLNPSFGMWHSNQLNALNLADDLVEPFRPIVDLYVLNNIQLDSEFTSKYKQDLVFLLNFTVIDSFDKQITLGDGIKNIVASYQSFCLEKREDIDIFKFVL